MRWPDHDLATLCVSFVRDAIKNALGINHTFGVKVEQGKEEHVGSADIANTSLAERLFSSAHQLIVIEEHLPPFSRWKLSERVAFVDPIDGSAEAGTGGCQFAAAVSLYGPHGVPLFAAAASPGLRPVFRNSSNSFNGFPKTIGTILFGGPDGLFLLPLSSPPDTEALPLT